MTNYQYYEKDLLEMSKFNKRPAVDYDGKLRQCNKNFCYFCILSRGGYGCDYNFIKWLGKENDSIPKLTKQENLLCQIFGNGWLARDPEGQLFYCVDKPEKYIYISNEWQVKNKLIINSLLHFKQCKFPFIKNNDEEPWKIEDLLLLEVKE